MSKTSSLRCSPPSFFDVTILWWVELKLRAYNLSTHLLLRLRVTRSHILRIFTLEMRRFVCLYDTTVVASAV